MDETAASQDRAAEYPAVPATFDFLVLSLKTQADMALGLIHFGNEEERPKPEPHAARHMIDLLAMLEEKTRGNLSMEERRLLENSLTELRFRYVQALEEQAKSKAEGQANE
jgi:hypothetical protein